MISLYVNFLVEHEINELKKEITLDQASNREKWNALLDANPVHFAQSITWAENITVVPEAELNTSQYNFWVRRSV